RAVGNRPDERLILRRAGWHGIARLGEIERVIVPAGGQHVIVGCGAASEAGVQLVGTSQERSHAARYRVICVTDIDAVIMYRGMMALIRTPCTSGEFLELLPILKGSRGMMVDHQPFAGSHELQQGVASGRSPRRNIELLV